MLWWQRSSCNSWFKESTRTHLQHKFRISMDGKTQGRFCIFLYVEIDGHWNRDDKSNSIPVKTEIQHKMNQVNAMDTNWLIFFLLFFFSSKSSSICVAHCRSWTTKRIVQAMWQYYPMDVSLCYSKHHQTQKISRIHWKRSFKFTELKMKAIWKF